MMEKSFLTGSSFSIFIKIIYIERKIIPIKKKKKIIYIERTTNKSIDREKTCQYLQATQKLSFLILFDK